MNSNLYKNLFWWVLFSHLGASVELRQRRRQIRFLLGKYEALGKTALYLAKLLEDNGIELDEFDLIAIHEFAREANQKEL